LKATTEDFHFVDNLYIEGNEKSKLIFLVYVVYVILMYNLTSYLIDIATLNYSSLIWVGGAMCLIFWPFAFYLLYVGIKSMPFSVFPTANVYLPFRTKQRIGYYAKISGISMLAAGVLFSSLPFFLTYELSLKNKMVSYQHQLEEDMKKTKGELERLRERKKSH
jgi:hypothetical protein